MVLASEEGRKNAYSVLVTIYIEIEDGATLRDVTNALAQMWTASPLIGGLAQAADGALYLGQSLLREVESTLSVFPELLR